MYPSSASILRPPQRVKYAPSLVYSFSSSSGNSSPRSSACTSYTLVSSSPMSTCPTTFSSSKSEVTTLTPTTSAIAVQCEVCSSSEDTATGASNSSQASGVTNARGVKPKEAECYESALLSAVPPPLSCASFSASASRTMVVRSVTSTSPSSTVCTAPPVRPPPSYRHTKQRKEQLQLQQEKTEEKGPQGEASPVDAGGSSGTSASASGVLRSDRRSSSLRRATDRSIVIPLPISDGGGGRCLLPSNKLPSAPRVEATLEAPVGSVSAAIVTHAVPDPNDRHVQHRRIAEGGLLYPSRLTYRMKATPALEKGRRLSIFPGDDTAETASPADGRARYTGQRLEKVEASSAGCCGGSRRTTAARQKRQVEKRDEIRQSFNHTALKSHHVPLVPFVTEYIGNEEQQRRQQQEEGGHARDEVGDSCELFRSGKDLAFPTLEEDPLCPMDAKRGGVGQDGNGTTATFKSTCTDVGGNSAVQPGSFHSYYAYGRRAGAGMYGGGRSVFLAPDDPLSYWLAEARQKPQLVIEPIDKRGCEGGLMFECMKGKATK